MFLFNLTTFTVNDTTTTTTTTYERDSFVLHYLISNNDVAVYEFMEAKSKSIEECKFVNNLTSITR